MTAQRKKTDTSINIPQTNGLIPWRSDHVIASHRHELERKASVNFKTAVLRQAYWILRTLVKSRKETTCDISSARNQRMDGKPMVNAYFRGDVNLIKKTSGSKKKGFLDSRICCWIKNSTCCMRRIRFGSLLITIFRLMSSFIANQQYRKVQLMPIFIDHILRCTCLNLQYSLSNHCFYIQKNNARK